MPALASDVSPQDDMSPRLIASVCCDLGGTVNDWLVLRASLRAGGYPNTERWERSEDAWQVNWRVVHPPVLLIDEREIELKCPGLSETRKPRREIRIYPTGVLVFRFVLFPAPPADLTALYGLRVEFQRLRRAGYISHLRESYPERAANLDEAEEPESDGGLGILDLMRDVQGLCQGLPDGVIDAREQRFPALYVRWALCVDKRPRKQELTKDLATLAEVKQLCFPADDVDGYVPIADVESVRLRAWPGLVLASWEGFDVYIGADSVEMREIATDSLELSHQYGFVCRAWIEILERVASIDVPQVELSDEDVLKLEARMLKLSRLERSLAGTLVELDSTDVMLVDTLRLQIVDDYAVRFKLAELKEIVFEHIDALTRENAVSRAILDRNYQHTVNKQGERLQYLFAGAVAAQLVALLPAAWAFKNERLEMMIGVAFLTVVLWAVLVGVALQLAARGGDQPTGASDAAREPTKPVSMSSNRSGTSR